jgi:GTP-binding protein
VNGFVDEARIQVSSGKGGNGCVSFRREKYIPRGGPDGGDGGKGGDVVFVVRTNLKTLAHLRLKRIYRAENGRQGSGNRKTGRDGKDVEIPVPPGTQVSDDATGESIADLFEDGSRFILLKGGKGGKGNSHYATPTNQAPRYAQEGRPGGELTLKVELHLIADVGLVGCPNAGKSTLLSVLTNARPLIADYPFTTRTPNLGLMRISDASVVVADIPGIIEGASEGRGLGLRFLRHIDRCTGLLFLVDLSQEAGGGTVEMLAHELEAYSDGLAGRPRLIVGTKLDAEGARERLAALQAAHASDTVMGVSSFSREGLNELSMAILKLSRAVK